MGSRTGFRTAICLVAAWILYSMGISIPNRVCAFTVDGIAATVNNRAITLSELIKTRTEMRRTVPGITTGEVLNSMINRILLVEEAKKMKMEAASDDDLIRSYLDLRIDSLIIVKEDVMRSFYRDHEKEFGGKPFTSVRDEIEKYLFQKESVERMKKHVAELRKKAEIIVLITDG